jgi:hypothetical protein
MPSPAARGTRDHSKRTVRGWFVRTDSWRGATSAGAARFPGGDTLAWRCEQAPSNTSTTTSVSLTVPRPLLSHPPVNAVQWNSRIKDFSSTPIPTNCHCPGGVKTFRLYRECAGAERPERGLETDRRCIPDTTTCTKPLYFGRTIAFMGIGISRACGRSVTLLS